MNHWEKSSYLAGGGGGGHREGFLGEREHRKVPSDLASPDSLAVFASRSSSFPESRQSLTEAMLAFQSSHLADHLLTAPTGMFL